LRAFFNFSNKKESTISLTSSNLYRRRKDLRGSQIERLKRDSRELKHYMKKMEKRGDTNLVHKLKTKYEYLNYRISEIELDIAV
jgi:hypothetical protein|tara:strand:- start:304 stop:555 length:252 start_codon:yes stop_codon:yes gene_type:complete